MKNTDAAWLAGIIDGEGSMLIAEDSRRIHAPSFEAQVSVVNTNKQMVDYCKKIGDGCVQGPIGQNRPDMHKPAFRWCVKRKKADVVIKAILPYLITKQEQAGILLHLISQTNAGACKGQWGRKAASEDQVAYRRMLKFAVQALNHRGTSSPLECQMESLAKVRAIALAEQWAGFPQYAS